MMDDALQRYVPPGVRLQGPSIREDVRQLVALGAVVRESAALDDQLRDLACALVGSPYAIFTFSGAMTSTLVEDCTVILRAQLELSDESKERLLVVLERCREAYRQRNRFVHDVWAQSEGGPIGLRSRRRTPATTEAAIQTDAIVANQAELAFCTMAILQWMESNLDATTIGMGSWLAEREALRGASLTERIQTFQVISRVTGSDEWLDTYPHRDLIQEALDADDDQSPP